MVPDQVEEWLTAHKIPGAPDRMAVSALLGLVNEREPADMISGKGAVSGFIVGMDHDAGVGNSRADRLFDDDAEDRLLVAVAVDQGLQGEMALPFSGSGDDCFRDLHVQSG
jgi:hypothetical protein